MTPVKCLPLGEVVTRKASMPLRLKIIARMSGLPHRKDLIGLLYTFPASRNQLCDCRCSYHSRQSAIAYCGEVITYAEAEMTTQAVGSFDYLVGPAPHQQSKQKTRRSILCLRLRWFEVRNQTDWGKCRDGDPSRLRRHGPNRFQKPSP